MNDSIKVTGKYTLEIYDFDSTLKTLFSRFIGFFSNKWKTAYVKKYASLKWSEVVFNTVVSAGKAQLALLAGDASAVPFTYLAVGTSNTAVSAGQTALQAEITDTGLARVAATISRTTTSVTNDTYQATYTWTASGTKAVEEIGIFNASSSGTMLSRALTATQSLVNGNQLVATYTVQFA